MNEQAKVIGANVAKLRTKASMSQGDLAKQIGVRQNTIFSIESGKTLKSRYLPEIANFFHVPLTDINPFLEQDATEGVITKARVIPGNELLSERDMPLFSSVEGGQGALVLSSEPIGNTRRPARLENVRGAYGLIVVGESMVPALRPGDVVHVHPALKPRPEDVCVFICEQNGEFVATIKEYVGQTEEHWNVKRYKPKEQNFTLRKKDWTRCEVVVGKYSGR